MENSPAIIHGPIFRLVNSMQVNFPIETATIRARDSQS